MLTSLLLGVSFVGIQAAFACTCIPFHPQYQLCTADFVIEAQIVSEEYESLDRIYNITLIKVYKVTLEGSNVINEGKLVTKRDSAACGIKLLIGKKYLLTGRIFQNWPTISLCNFYKSADTLSDFENLYLQNCNCNVITEGYTNSEITNQTCLWNTYNGYTEDCQRNYAVCKYNGDYCNWDGNTIYNECLLKKDI